MSHLSVSTNARKSGNSIVTTIPQAVQDALGIGIGTEIVWTGHRNGVIITTRQAVSTTSTSTSRGEAEQQPRG